MDTREAIVFRLKQLCEERGLTPNGLSNLAAVPQATVKSILNGESQNPGTVTIKNSVMGWRLPWESSFPRRNSMPWSRKSNSQVTP